MSHPVHAKYDETALTRYIQSKLDRTDLGPIIGKKRRKVWLALTWREQKSRCIYCNEKMTTKDPNHERFVTVEHITPLSRGGDNSDQNLALACRKCNLEKGNMTVDEWFEHKELMRRMKTESIIFW